MQNKSYSDLFALISGLAGVSDFTTEEEAYILDFVNRRCYQAYRSNSVWPRYIVGGQLRPATDSVISREFSPATLNVATATRSGTTVTIRTTAAVDFVSGMEVVVANLSGSVNANGTQTVTGVSTTTIANDTFTYELSSGTGSETYTGTATVTAVALPDIDTFYRVFNGNPLNQNSVGEYEYYVDVDGCHVINNATGLTGFYVSFYKDWGGPYTTASTDIPQEFFYYVAHAAYADFLRMDRQTDKAQIEETIAQQYLMIEIDKAENTRNVNNVYRRISTHLSRQARY